MIIFALCSEIIEAGDDFAMMRQVLSRRFARALKEDPARQGGEWPDLVLILLHIDHQILEDQLVIQMSYLEESLEILVEINQMSTVLLIILDHIKVMFVCMVEELMVVTHKQ